MNINNNTSKIETKVKDIDCDSCFFNKELKDYKRVEASEIKVNDHMRYTRNRYKQE